MCHGAQGGFLLDVRLSGSDPEIPKKIPLPGSTGKGNLRA
ncbi:hypothetical protein SUBVAR_06003 [Subdoligranulum variabile DSM 15176]|uniref:Uncharacterized protein n=1 Tax=Subdoligranulum variabile DSM 15176 TaxID=411471 RepID=D1PNT2_9FIRM|nr:hypothetical protein SUBVAR_06003 [Subdoligranulum variabile DSM 15176]